MMGFANLNSAVPSLHDTTKQPSMVTEGGFELTFPLPNDTAQTLSHQGDRGDPGPPLLSELTVLVFQIIFYVILCAVISLFGTITNVINVVVFFRLGLFTGSSSNLNLFFLSVADLGLSFTGLLHSIGFGIISADPKDLSWDPFAVTYLVAGWPNMAFVIANRLLTAYIVFERCMCVVLPFRVKTMFTPRKSVVYIAVIFGFASINLVPVYTFNWLGFEEQEGGTLNNVSKLVLIIAPEWGLYNNIVNYTSFFALCLLCVLAVLVCTFITTTRIRTSNKWKKAVKADKGTTGAEQKTTASSKEGAKDGTTTAAPVDKEMRLVKTINVIAVIFLVCYIPEFILMIMQAIEPRIQTFAQFYRLTHAIYSIVIVVTAFNSSINIFVYYTMNSKYRQEMLVLFNLLPNGRKE